MVSLQDEQRPARRGRFLARLGTILMVIGLLLALAVAGIYAYGRYEEYQFERDSVLRRQAFEQERAAQQQQQAEQARLEQERAQAERQAQLAAALPTFETSPTPVAPPAPAKPAPPSPARRLIIPAIGVDSEVVESEMKNGEWSVPKFVVGHLQGTAQPNEVGNAAYSGHIQSISSGNVFAELGNLKVGDQIYLLTTAGQYLYEVKQIKVVANTDISVVQPTPDPTVTLITCTGTWDFATHDYLQRLVVVAKLYRDTQPTLLPVRPR